MKINPEYMTDVEKEKAAQFEDDHYGCTITYIFKPTGIGTGITVHCIRCGDEENITDYESW